MEPITIINNNGKENGPILHVIVVGFHHKKGCQVEYVYPPFDDGCSVENVDCPEEWKHLPSLALPDGAHNYEKDTVFFHLPSRADSSKAVFGISCYRQINAECLLNRSNDITRGTVQKSVCVLSTLPLYGLINAKLELITHAYFDEKDFTKVALLEETFKYLNSSLKEALNQGHQIYLGLSIRDLVLRFKHRLVLLLKLVLLERKVLFLKSPVKTLCTTILSLLSVFPGMIEHGLDKCVALCSTKLKDYEVIEYNEKDDIEQVKDEYKSESCDLHQETAQFCQDSSDLSTYEERSTSCTKNDCSVEREKQVEQLLADLDDLLDGENKEKVDLTKSKLEFCDKDTYSAESDNFSETTTADQLKGSNKSLASNSSLDNTSRISSSLKGKMFNPFSYWNSKDKTSPNENPALSCSVINEDEMSIKRKADTEDVGEAAKSVDEEQCCLAYSDVLNLDINKCGLPLHIFDNGFLCHPYLSLPFLDLLKDGCVRGFVAGATNVLFKQKKNLVDVVVDLEDGKIEVLDLELKKELYLTTEDLRFGDFLVKNVFEDQNDVFLDGTGWEGGDEWLRGQLKYYILCLLRTSLIQEENRIVDSFNQLFMSAWKQTHNYSVWMQTDKDGILEINPGHPFNGQLSMADMKLRISHTMQNSERGKKINQAVVNTGKAVIQTSKVLGGAISQAKSAVFSWFQVSNSAQTESGDH